MSRNEFMAECVKRLIDPAIALENPEVCAALKAREDEKVRQLLDTQF